MWSTTDEMRFINGLGTHRRPSLVVSSQRKLRLLKGYRRGMKLREVWGSLNREEIQRYVEEKISYYESLIETDRPKFY